MKEWGNRLGAPEDDHLPLSVKPSFPLPQHALSIGDATEPRAFGWS